MAGCSWGDPARPVHGSATLKCCAPRICATPCVAANVKRCGGSLGTRLQRTQQAHRRHHRRGGAGALIGACMENVEQRVKKIVAEQLGVNEAEVKNESSFVDDLGADSLDTVELVMALEEEFETEIPDEEAEKITTVQQAINFIMTHSKKS